MSGLKRFAVWPFDGERDDASVIEAFDHESAAEEYADGFDSEATEETLCVAELESEHVETFDMEPDYSRDWIATRRDPPLEAFGWVLSQVPRWQADLPRREAEEARFRAECAEYAVRRAQRNALYTVSDLGCAISLALAARGKLLALGIADEDHERVVAAHFALTELARGQR